MMRTLIYPRKESWTCLCRRPGTGGKSTGPAVKRILKDVRRSGDEALFKYTRMYDSVELKELKVPEKEIIESSSKIFPEMKNAIATAFGNIKRFHRSQLNEDEIVETMPGIKCRRKSVPIEKAGLYIPGGSAPLFSSVLMLGIPAKLAGCRQIIMCTPPDPQGNVNPLILYTAYITGITEIYKAGGAQAVAAMAYGTETVPQVYKIFGPGNRYVTMAKEMVQAEGVAIDMPAGPSEVLVIADEHADAEFVAADLLSQAEHGSDSQVVLLTESRKIISEVRSEIKQQITDMPRKDIAAKALAKSMMILLPSPEVCIDFSNEYAPEHLIINTENASELSANVINAGSVFVGKYSCESAGDYASGTNHTLPTNGYAKCYSGVSVDSFMKKITFQELTAEGIRNIGPVVALMAEAESLKGHKKAISVRLVK